MSDSGAERRQPSLDTIYARQNQLFGLSHQYEHAQTRPIKMGSSPYPTPFRIMPLMVEGLPQGRILVWSYQGFAPPMSIRIELNNLNSEQSANMQCALVYEAQLYIAQPNVETKRERRNVNILSYGNWSDEEGKIFPITSIKDPEFLKKVRFLVRDRRQTTPGNPSD